MGLALGANREGRERVKGKANRMQRSRIGSALVCVRWNAQYLELKLPESTRFMPITVVMVAVFVSRPIDCLTNSKPSSPLVPKRSYTKKLPQAIGSEVKH